MNRSATHPATARLRIHDTGDTLARSMARDCLELAQSRIQSHGAFRIALAGGRSPEALYRHLAASRSARTDWGRWEVFFTDERCVPLDHPDSNYRMACSALLDHVPIPHERIHPMVRNPDTPEADALAYADELAPLAPDAGAPLLDLIVLGVGADGHTASLFPGSDSLRIGDQSVTAAHHPVDKSRRITLTRPVLARARVLWFLVTGAGKAEVLERILAPRTPEDRMLPAALCDRGDALWYVDREAARGLGA